MFAQAPSRSRSCFRRCSADPIEPGCSCPVAAFDSTPCGSGNRRPHSSHSNMSLQESSRHGPSNGRRRATTRIDTLHQCLARQPPSKSWQVGLAVQESSRPMPPRFVVAPSAARHGANSSLLRFVSPGKKKRHRNHNPSCDVYGILASAGDELTRDARQRRSNSAAPPIL